MSLPKIELTKNFNVPSEAVYDAWVSPQAIKMFMKPADVVNVPEPIINPTVGGRFQFDMHVGENVMPHIGEYLILDRANQIQFTWNSMNTNNEDSLVTINIKSLSKSSCCLTLIHEKLPTDNSRNDHNKGWESILSHLDKFLK